MPTLSRFYGIVVGMYYDDHAPPHFHARYAEWQVSIEIRALEVLAGSMPRRAMALVCEWARSHRQELEDSWRRAQAGLPLRPIEPLR